MGVALIVALAVVSSLLVAMRRIDRPPGMTFWIFSRAHEAMYRPLLDARNPTVPPSDRINLLVLGTDAMAQRMSSGFTSDTPLADLIEVERSSVGQTFAGPLDQIGWTDLTPRIRAEHLDEQLNAPSFLPWTWHGRVFGLPHDVHPILLAYRADLVEKAGIDVGQIETWDDFARVMRGVMYDAGRPATGAPDRYPLNLWYSSIDQIEALILQNDGGLFDAAGRVILDGDANAEVIAHVVAWGVGPDRIAADAPEFTASGNQLRLTGYVVASITPDWLCGVWRGDLPALGGKMKLMPLPAWHKGGRRTSVWGGSMLGIPRRTKDVDAAWRAAKALYLSRDVAHALYESNNIISPSKAMWSDPMYDVPSAFFCGQAPGRMYIDQAPHVPPRSSSPFQKVAKDRVQEAVASLRTYAIANKVYDAAALRPEAKRLLVLAAADVRERMARNVFVNEATPANDAAPTAPANDASPAAGESSAPLTKAAR